MKTIFDTIEKKGFSIHEYKNSYLENNFYKEVTNIIIKHPHIWKNFVENILKNPFNSTYEGKLIIVAYRYLPDNLRISFDYIISRVFNVGAIRNKEFKDGFCIIEFANEKISQFFKKSGVWLEYLTLCAVREISDLFKQGVLIIWNKNLDKYNEIDILGSYENKNIIIECKDTLLYGEGEFHKLAKISRKIGSRIVKVFVVTKILRSHLEMAKKYGIKIIKYEYDYNEFAQKIKKLLISEN